MEDNQEYDFDGLYECECGYYPEEHKAHEEIYLLPSKEDSINIVGNVKSPRLAAFDFFLEEGFRRNGFMIYKATCPDCKKCVPIRIIPENFNFNKKQRYLLNKNADIELSISYKREDLISDEKILLMQQYNKRHNPDKKETFEEIKDILIFMNGLVDMNDNQLEKPFYEGTINMDYRLNGKLVGVGIVDLGKISLSSNYFYYDTSDEIMKRSIGIFTILAEIEFCQMNNISLYYLGYYLSECRKMNYKGKFLPHELRINDEWIKQTEQNFDV